MTIATAIRDGVLNDALETMSCFTTRGALTPATVISVIDNICLDLRMTVEQLPVSLRNLRSDAQARHRNQDVGYREDWVADKIVTCGLWAV